MFKRHATGEHLIRKKCVLIHTLFDRYFDRYMESSPTQRESSLELVYGVLLISSPHGYKLLVSVASKSGGFAAMNLIATDTAKLAAISVAMSGVLRLKRFL